MKTINLTSKQRGFLIQQRIKDPSRRRKINLKWGRVKVTPRQSLGAPLPSHQGPPGARARLSRIRSEPSRSPTRKTARSTLRCSEDGPGPEPRWVSESARHRPWSRAKSPRSGANLSRWWPIMCPRPFRGHIGSRREILRTFLVTITPSPVSTARETIGSRNSPETQAVWCREQAALATRHRHCQEIPALVGCQIILSA